MKKVKNIFLDHVLSGRGMHKVLSITIIWVVIDIIYTVL